MRHAKKKSRKKFLWIIGIAIIIICFFLWKNDHGPNGMPSNYHADQVNLNVKAAVAIDAKNEKRHLCQKCQSKFANCFND